MSSDGFPRVALVRQAFPQAPPIDVDEIVARGMAGAAAQGERIAVAVGSRGIARLPAVVAAVVRALRAAGARPFVIPAMGSHGGATPAGQREVLAHYGVTEESVGAPVADSLEVERIGETAEGMPVFCSREALGAAGIVLVNRIKPHTNFRGTIGSGLLKMSVIGLGKRSGAAAFHQAVVRHGYERMIRAASAVAFARAPIRRGVALIENALHQLAHLEVLRAEEIATREPALHDQALAAMARLPYQEIDLLVVDHIGKHISGSGMDPNVVGRGSGSSGDERMPGAPEVHRIFVREIDPAGGGNAIGIGLADFTTERLVRAMDKPSTFVNSLTSLSLGAAKIPIHFASDREAMAAALDTLQLADRAAARVVRIRDTLALSVFEASEACLRPGLDVIRPPAPVAFDAAGNLPPLPI